MPLNVAKLRRFFLRGWKTKRVTGSSVEKLCSKVGFILRHHTKEKVVVFMHPHPSDTRKTLYWEGPSMAQIDLKGHVVLAETPILKLIHEELQSLKKDDSMSDVYFKLFMPIPQLDSTSEGLVLRVTSQKDALWHCNLFFDTTMPDSFRNIVLYMRQMTPFISGTLTSSRSFYAPTRSTTNFRSFTNYDSRNKD